MRKCSCCKKAQPLTEFYRKRRNGWGKFLGDNARRGICRTCERRRWPRSKWTPRYPVDRRTREGRKIWREHVTKLCAEHLAIIRSL